jgi:hypothetical protein
MNITGFISNLLRPKKILKKTRIKLNITPALSILLHGSENWTTKARDARRITAAEMKYMRITAGCTWTDHTTNRDCKGIKYNPSFGQNTSPLKRRTTSI